MPQVSRRKVAKDVEAKLVVLFQNALKDAADDKVIASFFESLLTTTEKKMFAKRIAIAFMLMKGFDYLMIGETLKVSKQTVWTIKKDVEGNKKYCSQVKKMLKKENFNIFWKKLDITIMEAIPPVYRTDWVEHGRELQRKKRDLSKGF